ncbi:fibrous sheath-interacting protein 2 [Cavia porcellus]|uniref:fibrous sheath-interacting protein 2 n=1 Tax=Cavia porcellus TaxID=10141 RepID=UPI002FDFE643
MELYLGACAKVAHGAATRTAARALATESRQCGDGAHKTHFAEVGAAQLLDLPLGVKLPVIPGSDPLFFTTNLSEKLFRPSYGFNLTDPYCRLLENQYRSLHDPHLKAYYRRKDVLRRLKKGGYITNNNKIVCSLKELNKYRQYLTNLKLDFERNYIREQKMLAKQLQKLEESNAFPECSDVTQFQNWLLHEGTQSIRDQERLIRHRYLDMINKGLEHSERAMEEQRLLRMDREHRRQREHLRRKLILRRKIEEEWKTKELLLLTKIAEDIKREQKLEQQRRKSREERDRKKQALLEKKMAYHLQKMQETGFKEDMDKGTYEYSGQDGDLEKSATNTIFQSQSCSKNIKRLASAVEQSDLQENGTEQKRDGMLSNISSTYDDKGPINISAQHSPTKNNRKSSYFFMDTKTEKEINGKAPKSRPSYYDKSGFQAPGILPSPVVSNIQQNLLQNCVQGKVTSEELNSIIQNIMTWVVATVTSILYPAITRYEERLHSNTYAASEESTLSSDSSSFCSTCSEEFTYRSYTSATTKTFQADTCSFAVNVSGKKPSPILKPPPAPVEREVMDKTHHRKGPSPKVEREVTDESHHWEGQTLSSELKYDEAHLTYSYPTLRSCSSDSQLLASLQRGTKKSKDATTETDGSVTTVPCEKKAKAMDELKNLKNVFVNFKCHLKGETKLILESIFQEIMSDLTQAIPCISSVTAEVFVDQSEPEKDDLISSIDMCSLASDIVENVFDKLESAVEKKCVQIFSQEELSVDMKSSLTSSGEYFTSSNGKPSEDSLPYAVEPMCTLAEDMVHGILEKLMIFTSVKQNERPLEDATKHQQQKTDPPYTVLQRASQKRSTSEQEEKANIIANEEIKNLMSNVFSQSCLVHHIEEAVSTILGYLQTELNHDRLLASEQTIIFLQILDEIFTHLHHKPVKPSVHKKRRSTQRNSSDMKEKYRLTGTTMSHSAKGKRPCPRVNVPGMVFYSEDDNEEINNIVKNAIDSSLKEERAKSREKTPNHRFTKANTSFDYTRNAKPPTMPSSRSSSNDWELKTELPPLINEDILKEKHCLNRDISVFSHDEKHQIKRASEKTVKHVIREMLKDIASVSPGRLGNKTGKETSSLPREKSQGLLHQEWMDQMFSMSEITSVAQEITDSVLNILFKASHSLSSPAKSSASSLVHQTFPDNPDVSYRVTEVANKKPLKIWFDSDKKMKRLPSLNVDSAKPSWLKSGESEPKCVDNIVDKITNTVFKRLKLFVCPKLQTEYKLSSARQSLLKSQLSTYTAKVVNIVLDAIQNELELSKKNVNLRDLDHSKSHTSKGILADADKKLESLIANLNDDNMESPILTWICEILLSGNGDQRNSSLSSGKSRSTTSNGNESTEKQNILSSRRDKEAFRKYLATPCTIHSTLYRKGLKEKTNVQVLDRIGETVHEMLDKLVDTPPDLKASFREQKRENAKTDQQMAAAQKSNVQVISKTILEYILEKLCCIDMDTSLASTELKAALESPDIDKLSFASIIEEMGKCTDIISSIISGNPETDNPEVTKSKTKNISSGSSKFENSKEAHQNTLKAVASDILNMVFTNLEGFANGNLEIQDAGNDGNKKGSKVDGDSGSSGAIPDTREEPIESVLYTQAKKVSSALLKSIQTELNGNSDDLKKSVKKQSPETRVFTDIVNLILDVVSSDTPHETESKDRDVKTYRYQPTYGNFLPGGAESDSFPEDDGHTEKKVPRERKSLRQGAKFYSPKQKVLETSLCEIEMKLTEPHKSPVIPIIRNILNEIFQNNLINQLNVLLLSNSHFDGIPHDGHESIAQKPAQFMGNIMGPLVSDTDVVIVASDIVRIVFHKLYTAAMTEENVSENRCKSITFSSDASFCERTYGGNSLITLDRNLCMLQPRFSVDKQSKVNMIEDIVQTIFQNLETFATSKIKSLVCSQVNFTAPEVLPTQQDEGTLSKSLSSENSYSDGQFSFRSVEPKTNIFCQISLSKLNIYAKDVARKILQGIKHELDKERESSFLIRNIVVSEGIVSQIVNTVLDIISCKKIGNSSHDKQNDSAQADYVIEKLFNKTEYQKILQFQIQNTIEGILCDIYEKTLYKNNFSFATPTLKYHIADKCSEASSEICTQGTNKISPDLPVPRSDVLLLCKEVVDIVLHSLASAARLGIVTEVPALARSTFCDTFSKTEYQTSLLMESKAKGKPEWFQYASDKEAAYTDGNQTAVEEKEDPKQSAPDPCAESANFIAKTIFNRLQTFATERVDSLITLAFQPEGTSFVSPALENCRQDDSVSHELNQVELHANVPKRSTKTILSQKLTEPTSACYRGKIRATIHLSKASLKEYADIIAKAILKLIKNDLDLEIQKMQSYPNDILFQKNVIVSEIIDNILKVLHNKISIEEISVSSEKTNFAQLTPSNEIPLGQKEKEKGTSSLLTNCPLEQNQMTFEKESQRTVLEEIFMRKGKPEQKETIELLSKVAELLSKLDQRVMEIIGHLLPFNEVPHFNFRTKTSGRTGKTFSQSRISSIANDIIDCVYDKMYSVVVTVLYKNDESRGEGETSHKNDTSAMKALYFRGTKQAGKRSNSPRGEIPEESPNADNQNVSELGKTFQQYSSLQIAKDLTQIVFNKIRDFVSLHLEENLSITGYSEELQLYRLQNSKDSIKDGSKPGFKTNLKTRPLHKFKSKLHAGPSAVKAKSKGRLSTGEKTPRDGQTKTSIRLPHIFATGDAKNLLETKLPPSELKVYAKDMISNILEAIMKEFERVTQNRTMAPIKVLPSDQIMESSKIVSLVLQELNATSNSLAYPIKSSCLDHLKFSSRCLYSPAKEQACFYLEDVSSQLEQIFPKEGIFKKMFDKWQTDSNDMENEKHTLLTIADNILTEISIKAKDLEYSLSLLNLPFLEHGESSFSNQSKEDCSRAEDTKAQITMFGREIVEMLFEKLQLCFLSQMPISETPTNEKELSTGKSKHGFPTKYINSSLDIKTKDQIPTTSYKQVTQEIVGRVLNLLESFVDLQFKHISKYEFSEIVKVPIDNLFQVQQRRLNKKMSPKLQPLKNSSDECKPTTVVSKESIQNTLLQVHSFHSELLTYAVRIVCDMLAVIKSKLDKEINQMGPSSTNTLKENIVASEIIGTLMDQCSHFSESLTRNLSVESSCQRTKNAYPTKQDEPADDVKMPSPQLDDANWGHSLLQRSEPSLVFYSLDNTRREDKLSSPLPSCVTSVEHTIKSLEPLERSDSEAMSLHSRNKVQEHHQVKPTLGHLDEAVKRNGPLPEGSVLQKLLKKTNESTEASLQQVMSFLEMGKGENPRIFHYGAIKPVVEPNQIHTTVSPLRICLAAENIVSTVLSSYGFPEGPLTTKSMETMKPFFISKQNSFSEISSRQKNEKENLFRMWPETISCGSEEGEIPEPCGEDFSLLQKWQNKTPKIKKVETPKEATVIAFADHELGPNEIHLLAMHVTTSVVTYLKNFKTREKVSLVFMLSSKSCDSRQPLRSMYSNSSVNQFCKHLTESVICHLISSIYDGTIEGREKDKLWEIQSIAFNKIILIHSQVFENRSISIGELALSISETVIEILANNNIVEAHVGRQMVSTRKKYIYSSGITSANLDGFFQDLLTGVIQVLSEEIGINHHFKKHGRRKSCSLLASHNVSIFSNVNTKELPGLRGWESSSTRQIDQIVQKNKLNYLASQLDILMGSLKTDESKKVVNKVFNIILDLFLPDEFPGRAMDSGKLARGFSSPINQQSNSILRNNRTLSPKSAFLLNVVCEKLIRTLLEKCAATSPLDDDLLASEISAEVHQLLRILHRIEDGNLDYYKSSMDCRELQGDCMSDLLGNLAETNQDILSSDYMLNIISHSLVKSLMDKLSQGLQEDLEGPLFENKCLNHRRREIQSNFTEARTPELKKLGQVKDSLGFTSYDSASSTGFVNNPRVASSKVQGPFGKQCTIKSSSWLPLNEEKTKEIDKVVIRNIYQRDMYTGVYSASFLEEIISELFFHFSTCLWEKNADITEAQLNTMNTLFVSHVVNEFNNAQVTVLRNAEERLYFPPIHKEMVRKIVDSVYYDVLHKYEWKVTSSNLAGENKSIAQQVAHGILLEVLDYQLPSSLKANLRIQSCYPLEAEVILQKLQSNLRNLTLQAMSSKSYSTMLPYSFLEDVIRRLLLQLSPPSGEPSSLGKTYATSSDFNEMSTCITNKVMSAISRHKIWFTTYENQYLSSEKNLQKMVDSVYGNILQMSDSLVSIQKDMASRSPIMMDRIASFIIQEIIDCHLQPFLCGEVSSRPGSPLDAVSNMVKQVLNEVLESCRPQKPPPVGISPDVFIGEMVAKLLSKIFSPRSNTEFELESMTQRIIHSVNEYFDKGGIHILYNDKKSFPCIDTDVIDELVTSVYRDVLNQYGLDPNVNKETENSDSFVENITNLIVAAISNYLLHPLFSGDLSTSSYTTLLAENIVQDVLSNISQSTSSDQSLSPYNTLLPYTFLEDMIRVLLSRFFPAAPSVVSYRETPQDKSEMNYNEIASSLISDIRMKISQHEIQFSKEKEEIKFAYSEDDVQHLVDSVFNNILQKSKSEESVEQNNIHTNDVLIDKIAAFIIKYVCEQHLRPFLDANSSSSSSSSSSSYTYFDDKRQQSFFSSVYSSTFLEDVVSGVLRKIFHRVFGVVQMESMRDSENEFFDKAEKLIHLITEEFSKAQVTVIENAERQLNLLPVETDVVKTIIGTAYSRVLDEYQMEIKPQKDFLSDTGTLASRITKIILTEIFDFQIPPDLIANLPFKSHSKLSENVLIHKVQHDITKSRSRRQASTMYTTLLSQDHLEKIVTQLVSQTLTSTIEHPDTAQSDVNDTIIKLINEIMSIISKNAICVTKQGNKNQNTISEKDVQSMIDSIYADLAHSDIYKSLTKDKKDMNNIPVSKIASFIIKEIFNHHLQSFLSGDKPLLSASVDQIYEEKARDPKQKRWSCIVNSAVFLEEVIAELLCKILHAFTHNVLVFESTDTAKVQITNIVTALVKSIVVEFNTSEIRVADNLDKNLCFSEEYKEMVRETVNLIYKKLLDEYSSLVQVYKAIQSDSTCFGRKIYHLLLEEIYEYQVQSLISGELVASCCASLQADNIIRNVLSVILSDRCARPSFVTVFPHSLLEDMISKLLVHIFPQADTENKLTEEELTPDENFSFVASDMTDEIIKEIFEHEIRLATAMENAESTQLEVLENLVDSVCNNILKKPEYQAEVQKDAGRKEGPFLSKIAGFIMKEIMDHHLQPFLHGEESSSSNSPDCNHASVVAKSGKETSQVSLFSATFLEDVVVDLVQKFFSFSDSKDSKKRTTPEPDIVSLAVKFANALLGEFRKNEIKVLPQAEEKFSFPPIAKEIVADISSHVYNQFIGKFGSNDIQKHDKSNIVVEIIAALAQKAISAFKIQPLFSGDWSSTFFSFLNPDTIMQRVQHLPQDTCMQIARYSKEKQLTLPEQSCKQTSLSSDQKKMIVRLEQNRGAMNRKNFHIKELSVKKEDIPNPMLIPVPTIMESNRIPIMSGSSGGMAHTKKEDKKKLSISTPKNNKSASKVTSPATTESKKEQDLKKPGKNHAVERKKQSIPKKESQGSKMQTFSPVVPDAERKAAVPQSDPPIDKDKKRDNIKESSIQENNQDFQLSPWKPRMKSTETTTENTLKIMKKPTNEEMIDSSTETDMGDIIFSDYETVQNIIENIYGNVLERSSLQEPSDVSTYRYSKSFPGNKALIIIQEPAKESDQFVRPRSLSSVNKKDYVEEAEKNETERQNKKEKESEKEKEKTTEKEKGREKKVESKTTQPHYLPESKPRIFPTDFLDDVIIEIVKELMFSSSPEMEMCEQSPKVNGYQNQSELYDTAVKLTHSLKKEFSDVQVKMLFGHNERHQFFPHTSKVSSIPVAPSKNKASNTHKTSSSIKIKSMDKMPNVPDKLSPPEIPFLDELPLIDKTLVNKVAHSSICNILKEYRTQEALYQDIKNNEDNLVKRLTSGVINELFQRQLNLLFGDEVPILAGLPLDSKDLVKKIEKLPQTASKECQTTSPYTVMLPHQFLEDVISTLLSKIFSKISNTITKRETSEDKVSTELDFLQMELVSKIAAEISNDEDMIVEYVESLHPNDEEIIELVVQSIYNNLLPQFGSQEIIQNCISNGCRHLSKAIIDLVLREVAGNQLQNYFCGELTPYQCAEVDSVVENILSSVLQTTSTRPAQAPKVSSKIIEEIAVKFLSKLLSVFPKVHKKRTKSPETEMQKISSKILNSFQEFISRSKIKLTKSATESPTVSSDDSETIENIVNSVYTSILKHSGSHTSVFKDLMGQSNVLSDIIGFLMVKEIYNSEFQPQVEEEISSSELILEAVKIMEKVVKIVDKLKSQEDFSSEKCSMLDTKVLEEALALFLAKLVRLPRASQQDTDSLSKSELNKVASQLTKSVTAEVSKSNISLVSSEPEESSSNQEEMDMIFQVVDSVYSNILQQSGSHEELHDIKDTDTVLSKVASLIIDGVSKVPLDMVTSTSSISGIFQDLDIDRIIEKTEKHAKKMMDDKKSREDRSREECTVVIIPHVGRKAIKVDPQIISQHLAVISVKTEPLEKMKLECLRRTGHSIEELRRASIDGRSLAATSPAVSENRKKERRTSLNSTGRLDIKPYEAVCRNSFQNIRKPDISKVELLKDVQNRKDLIIRLVAHDIYQEDEEAFTEGDTMYDENEVVLGEYFGLRTIGELSEDEVKGVMKLMQRRGISSIPTATTSRSQSTSTSDAQGVRGTSNQTEPIKTQLSRIAGECSMTTSTVLTETPASTNKTSHQKKEENVATEPTHHFIHRIMSTSSYNQEDLLSSSSEEEDSNAISSPKILKEVPPESNSAGIQFISIFEGPKEVADKGCPAQKITSEAPKSSTSKQGPKLLARVSSTLSKVFSRSHSNVPKSSSPPSPE